MIKILTILALTLLLALPATAANVTKVEIHGVVFDEKSSTYNTTLLWDAQNFTGFYYNFNGGKSSETLRITQPASSLKASSRTIQKENLLYNTTLTDQNYTLFTETGKKVANGLNYNSSTNTFTKSTTGGKYAQLGWFGDRYVAVNGKANKLAKLVKEQKKEEKQTLKLGTTWDLGEGYNLTVEALDTRTSPRQAWLSLNKDGKTLENKVVNEGDVYTYIEKNVSGESDVPIFVTYVESIFTGGEGMATFVQLRYTWLISQNVLEVKEGDKFGVFEVKDANENYLLLYNKDTQIDLNQNTVQPLYGDLKFKVADKDTALRFYPFIEQTIPTASSIELKAASAATASTPTIAAPARTQTSAASPSTMQAAAPSGTLSPNPVQTEKLVKTPGNAAEPRQWYWVLFAIAGLVTTGYLVLRKD